MRLTEGKSFQKKQEKYRRVAAKSADYSKYPELLMFALDGVGGIGGIAALVKGGFVAADTKSVSDFVKKHKL